MVARDPVPKVRVVVLNYNGGDLTRQCLASLAATRWPADALEVVLVDNASTDDSVAPALAEHPATRLIARTDNGGFPANNDALRDLEGVDYVALVNNDAFVEPDWLAPLVATLEADPALGAACPKILFVERAVDGQPLVNNVGNDLLPNGYGVDRGFGEPDDGRFDEPVDVFAWCGAGVLLRSDYLRDVGLFDERLFLYYEDTDLAWRGRHRGWRYRTAPASVLHHVHSASTVSGSDLHRRLSERNRLLVLAKNAPARLALGAWLRFPLSTMSYAATEILRPMLRGRRPDAHMVALRVRSFTEALALAPAMLRDRRSVRSSSSG
jgi:N-acetylglucosaminyl-diphospho-decaprenol L-rhamnosyltransferase